jgi:membrane-associated phospholipid phosphatase
MDIFNTLGVDLILYLQSVGSWLVSLMKFFSFLGTDQFFLLILPLIYWSLDSALGIRMAIYLMISISVNWILKIIFHSPRPNWIDPSVVPFGFENSFGIPSGHAQNAVVIFGLIASVLRKTWAWVLAVAFVFLIGFSRLVLGLHYPGDVLAGWIVGAILLYLLLSLERPVLAWMQPKDRGVQLIVSLGFTIVLILVSASVTLYVLQIWKLPSSWFENAMGNAQEALFDPFLLDVMLAAGGALFGLAGGYIMIRSQGGFRMEGNLLQRCLRYVLGVAGLLVIRYGLGMIFPEQPGLISYGLRYLRYALIGFWISWWAPLLFIRLRLADQAVPASSAADIEFTET